MNGNLGYTFTDRISGFRGVCTGYVEYITGCNQLLLTPTNLTEGKPNDPQWFDEQRCVKATNSQITLDNGKTPGADKQAPIR